MHHGGPLKAIEAYKKLKTNIYKNKIYVNIGYSYDHLKEYDKALKCFNASIENNINAIPAYINIGAIFDLQSKDLQALDAFTKAIQHEDAFVKNENGVIAHPDLKYAYANLGTLYGKHGLFKTQLLYYKKAARLGEKLIQEQLEQNGETW